MLLRTWTTHACRRRICLRISRRRPPGSPTVRRRRGRWRAKAAVTWTWRWPIEATEARARRRRTEATRRPEPRWRRRRRWRPVHARRRRTEAARRPKTCRRRRGRWRPEAARWRPEAARRQRGRWRPEACRRWRRGWRLGQIVEHLAHQVPGHADRLGAGEVLVLVELPQGCLEPYRRRRRPWARHPRARRGTLRLRRALARSPAVHHGLVLACGRRRHLLHDLPGTAEHAVQGPVGQLVSTLDARDHVRASGCSCLAGKHPRRKRRPSIGPARAPVSIARDICHGPVHGPERPCTSASCSISPAPRPRPM